MAGGLLIKVCGVTRPGDAEVCADAGVDAVGINLWPGSKRYAPPEVAQAVADALPSGVLRVGVFVDAPVDEVRAAVDRLGLDHAQLHGDEDDVEAYGPSAFKAVRLSGSEALDGLEAWPGPWLLVDAYRPGVPGGTGETADWGLAAQAARRRPVILAGGLRPDNVAQAVREVRPRGVDVASGVEAAPGVKDPALIEAFVAAARSA